MRWALAALMGLVVVGSGCSSSEGANSGPTGPSFRRSRFRTPISMTCTTGTSGTASGVLMDSLLGTALGTFSVACNTTQVAITAAAVGWAEVTFTLTGPGGSGGCGGSGVVPGTFPCTPLTTGATATLVIGK